MPQVDLDKLCQMAADAGMPDVAAKCRALAQGAEQYCPGLFAPSSTSPAVPVNSMGKPGCNCGGKCGGGNGGCAGGQCGIPRQGTPQTGVQNPPSGASAMQSQWSRPGAPLPPRCYDCTSIDECLANFLYDAQLRLSPWEYEQHRINENPLVNLDKYVGAVSFQNFPLTANTSAIFAQDDAQVLPYRPLAVKAQAEWTGTEADSKVTLTFYAGPRGLVGLSDTSRLTQIGSPFKLTNFTCHRDCYFGPFPEFEGCRGSAVPYDRSIYVKVEVGSVGQSTLNGLALEIIKHKTIQARALCGDFNWFCG